MRRAITVALVSAILGCGGGGSDGVTTPTPTPTPVDNTPKATTLTFTAGDGQTALRGTAATTSPKITVKDQNGAAMGGIPVTFSVTSGGGSIVTTSTNTQTDGTASPGVWTMGATAGANVLKATATGGTNPTAQITATGRNPQWTIAVYMAGDNALSSGFMSNIDEMEDSVGYAEAQFVMQAEFSPTVFTQKGCTSSCFNRPNFNTFRFVVPTEHGVKTGGPNGTATDLGNRNMTDPLQLREFITYAKTTAPAERYMVIIAGNGGGHTGLVTDETSAPGVSMSLNDLATAFNGVGTVDVLAFDMSSAGSYETLAKSAGLASYVLFSEGPMPTAGFAYDKLTIAMGKAPPTTARTGATAAATAYLSKYGGNRASLTMSSYEMSGFSAFETALNALAGNLQANAVAFNSGIVAAAAGAQSFDNPSMKDFVNLMDSLRVQITNTTTRGLIDAAKTAHTAFLVSNNQIAGVGQGSQYARNVSRASGMSILLPSLTGNDRMPNTGAGSLASYQSLFSTKAWGQFINTWLTGKTETSYTDLGSNRFEAYFVWDETAVVKKADADMFVLEPDGTLTGPLLGAVSSNMLYTTDSYEHPPSYVEGFEMKRFVFPGTYKIYGYYWFEAPLLQLQYNVAYRTSQAAAFTNLYSGTPPRLTTTTKFSSDASPTLAKVESKSYTDFRLIAVVTIPAGTTVAGLRSAVRVTETVPLGAAEPQLTPAQLRMLQTIGRSATRTIRSGQLKRPTNLKTVIR